MLIQSVFESQQVIPIEYTCDGKNLSPPLKFLQVPAKAKSLALIVEDPDAPGGTFDHWLVWNLPPDLVELTEGAKEFARLLPSPVHGVNGYRNTHYDGPCPPVGKPHHYHFQLYALDVLLSLPKGSSKQQLKEAMQGHLLEQAELVGTYQHDE